MTLGALLLAFALPPAPTAPLVALPSAALVRELPSAAADPADAATAAGASRFTVSVELKLRPASLGGSPEACRFGRRTPTDPCSYFGARYYASMQGRFTSPDPMLLDGKRITDPQLWNLYSYVRNNPLAYVDPDGRDLVSVLRAFSFARGFANALGSNHMLGIGRGQGGGDYRSGQVAGDVASLVVGPVLVAAGGGMAGAGTAGAIATSPTGVGVVAGSGVAVGGLVVAGVGASGFTNGLTNLMSQNSVEPTDGTNPLPGRDETGKVHGELPGVDDLGRYSTDELTQFQGDLRASVQMRIQRTAELGPDPGHAARQTQEQRLVRAIEKILKDRH